MRFCKIWLFSILVFSPLSVLYASENIIDPAWQLEREERQRIVQEELAKIPEQVRVSEDQGIRFKPFSGCLPIKKIDIIGDKFLKGLIYERLQSDIVSYFNTCADSSTLNDLVLKLNTLLFNKGYITARVEVESYNKEYGELVIKIQEGRIESIKTIGVNRYTAFPGLVSKRLRAQDLDQGLEQLNRLPSLSSVIALWPGEKVGATVVKVETKKISKPYRLNVVLDNSGNERTGQNVFKGSFVYDNLLRLNDQFFLLGSKSGLGSERSEALVWKEEIPLGYYTFAYSGSYSDSIYNIQSGDDSWSLATHGLKNKLELLKNIYRDPSNQILFGGSFWHYSPKRRIMDVSLQREQKLSVFEVELQYNFYHEKFRILTELNYAQGTNFLGAKEYAKSYVQSHTKFRRYKLTSDYLWKISNIVNLHGNLQLQYADMGLPELVKLPILDEAGGIRGVKENSLTKDDGVILRHDLMFPVSFSAILQNKAFKKITMTPFLHGDVGWARGKGDIGGLKQFVGIGGGIRFNILNFNSKLTASKLIKKPSCLDASSNEGWVLMFELSQHF